MYSQIPICPPEFLCIKAPVITEMEITRPYEEPPATGYTNASVAQKRSVAANGFVLVIFKISR
jgi:hypothetical protein